MIARGLVRVDINVSNLPDAIGFYTGALGFTAGPIRQVSAAAAATLGVHSLRAARLTRGAQAIGLLQADPPGAPYPQPTASNDPWFQHCALVTADMPGSYARLCAHAFTPISRAGPQALPGGIVAFKFRDPDGHPLELIAFPQPNPLTAGGIDHSAIAVSDVARSIAFYAATLGLSEQARQLNTGPAQNALDDLDGVSVDVVALAPRAASPHVELLGYRTPAARAPIATAPADIASSRLVFASDDETRVLQDPDGHWILVEGQETLFA